MNIKDFKNRIAVLFKGLPPSHAASGIGTAYSDSAAALTKMFRVSHERVQTHKELHRMDADCEVTKFAFSTIASRSMGYPDPTVNSFTVTIEGRDKDGADSDMVSNAQAIIEDLIERANLRPEAWQIIRRGVKFGNEFDEILFEKDGDKIVRIAAFAMRPEHTIWPNKTPKGDRAPGYKQQLENTSYSEQVVEYAEYEMVHFSFGEKEDHLGTGLLSAARKNWKRLNLAEDSTAAARLVRAFMKLLHRIPVNQSDSPEAMQQAIDAYKRNMTKRKMWDEDNESLEMGDWPVTVKTDYFIPDDGSKRGGVEMFDPENAQLQNIKDIDYFLRRLITATTVPFRYFPFEGSTPKLSEGGGNSEDVNFACTLMMTHQMLQEGYNKLFWIELMLHGIDPTQLRIVYRMAPLNTIDQLRAAQTDVAKSKTLDTLCRVMPGIFKHPDVMLREFTSMSDVSIKKLQEDGKLTDGALEMLKSKNAPRVQLPGTGTGEETREQV